MTRLGTVLAGAWGAAWRDYLAGVFADDVAASAARRVVDNGAWLREYREAERRTRAEDKAFDLLWRSGK